MKLKKYIKEAKKQLDEMEELWMSHYKHDPLLWPLKMSEEEFSKQELAHRFDII